MRPSRTDPVRGGTVRSMAGAILSEDSREQSFAGERVAMSKPTKPKSRSAQQGRENTLGSQSRKLDGLLDELDSRDGDSVNRAHARRKYRERSVGVMLTQPDGSEVMLKLAARNLSVGGVSLLHSAFVYPGTDIMVDLPRVNGKPQRIRGKVMRCTHVQGVVHEVGVKFDELINLNEYKHADPFTDSFSYENVDRSRLTGTVIHIDPSQIDRQIVRHFLRDTSLSIRGCENYDEAQAYLEKGCDLLLAEFRLPEMDAAELTTSLRTEGHTMPVVVLSSSTSPETLEAIQRAAVDVFIPKPIEEKRLIAALAEFLAPDSADQEHKPASLDEGLKELASMFAASLGETAGKLEAALQSENTKEILSIASQIKGSALSLGYERLGVCASELMGLIIGQAHPESINRVVRKLVTCCRTARPVV